MIKRRVISDQSFMVVDQRSHCLLLLACLHCQCLLNALLMFAHTCSEGLCYFDRLHCVPDEFGELGSYPLYSDRKVSIHFG